MIDLADTDTAPTEDEEEEEEDLLEMATRKRKKIAHDTKLATSRTKANEAARLARIKEAGLEDSEEERTKRPPRRPSSMTTPRIPDALPVPREDDPPQESDVEFGEVPGLGDDAEYDPASSEEEEDDADEEEGETDDRTPSRIASTRLATYHDPNAKPDRYKYNDYQNLGMMVQFLFYNNDERKIADVHKAGFEDRIFFRIVHHSAIGPLSGSQHYEKYRQLRALVKTTEEAELT